MKSVLWGVAVRLSYIYRMHGAQRLSHKYFTSYLVKTNFNNIHLIRLSIYSGLIPSDFSSKLQKHLSPLPHIINHVNIKNINNYLEKGERVILTTLGCSTVPSDMQRELCGQK